MFCARTAALSKVKENTTHFLTFGIFKFTSFCMFFFLIAFSCSLSFFQFSIFYMCSALFFYFVSCSFPNCVFLTYVTLFTFLHCIIFYKKNSFTKS